MFGRRLHNAFKHAISDGDGRTDDEWLYVEKPVFAHNICSMYLTGCLAFLEDKYGERPWNEPANGQPDLAAFIENLPEHPKANLSKVTKDTLDALVCIRNAVVHNENDLSENRDTESVKKVTDASLPGVTLQGSMVTLLSENTTDFMEFVRKSFVAVSMYYGDS